MNMLNLKVLKELNEYTSGHKMFQWKIVFLKLYACMVL